MYNRLLKRKIHQSQKSVLLLGARQVGKSTLLKSLKPDLTINLANESEYFTFQGNNNELETRLAAKNPTTVMIDEIQRIPRLLNTVQALIDDNTKLKFYLSGSSARKLKRGNANLLPGRLFTYHLNPLCLNEFDTDWDESHAMQFGCLPGVSQMQAVQDKKKLLLSYSNSYLKEEIMAESLVRSLDGFVRFLREAALRSGSFLDYSKLAKLAKVPRQSVVRHFEILEDTLIAYKISNDPDLDSGTVDLVKHPRIFFFDVGVVNALRGGFGLSQDRVGHLWEHLVFNQIKNSSVALDRDCEIYNFRTRGGLEVDFVTAVDGKKTAIECKSAQSVDRSDYQNLHAIKKYYPKIQKLVIYRGKLERKDEDVWILPLKKALDTLGLK